MDCKGFRKYIGAFADGELQVEQNLAALEHLNMCQACAARVNAVSSLKATLKRVYGGIQAPQHVRERVLRALEIEAKQARLEATPPVVPGVHHWRGGFTVALGVAAALLLAFVGWQFLPDRGPRTDVRLVVPGRLAADVREQHRFCIGHRGANHNDVSLPRDLPVIAERLSARLNMKVIAPDLSSLGFELIGADSCGVKERPGAHIVYRSVATGKQLSVFTVDRWASLEDEDDVDSADRGFFVSSDDDSLCVVAWLDGPQAYILCADLPEPALLEIGGLVSGATASQLGVPSGTDPCLAITMAPTG